MYFRKLVDITFKPKSAKHYSNSRTFSTVSHLQRVTSWTLPSPLTLPEALCGRIGHA